MAHEPIDKIRVHPSCNNFRKLTKEEYAILSEGILKVMVPVLVCKVYDKATGTIITWLVDGVHRFNATKDHGKNIIDCQIFDGSLDAAIAQAEKLNKGRRQEPFGKRALTAAKEVNTVSGGAQKCTPLAEVTEFTEETQMTPEKQVSVADAAERNNVSERTVQQARKVIDQGEPELIDAVEEGFVSVSDAVAIATEPPATQTKAVNRVRTGKAKTVKASVNGKPTWLKSIKDLWAKGNPIEQQEFREWIEKVCHH